MFSPILSPNSKGEGSPSQSIKKLRVGMVKASLLARLKDQGVPLDAINVQALGLKDQASKKLRTARINTLQQLINYTESDLLSIPYFGRYTARHIKNKLNSYLTSMLNRNDRGSQVTHDSVLARVLGQNDSELQVIPGSALTRVLGHNDWRSQVTHDSADDRQEELQIRGKQDIREVIEQMGRAVHPSGDQASKDVPANTPTTGNQVSVDYKKVNELDLESAAACNNRGCAYDEKGDYDQAITDYTKAFKIDPRFVMSKGMIVEPSLLERLIVQDTLLDKTSVGVLMLSTRSHNALTRAGINTIQELINCTEHDLLGIRNIGVTSLAEINSKISDEYLSKLGLKLLPQSSLKTDIGIAETSLLAWLKVQDVAIDESAPDIGDTRNEIVMLNPIPLRDIPLGESLTNELALMGLESSLDLWVLAVGYHAKVDPVFSKLLEETCRQIMGQWSVQKQSEFKTHIEVTSIPTLEGVPTMYRSTATGVASDSRQLRVTLSIRVSKDGIVYWEALLPGCC